MMIAATKVERFIKWSHPPMEWYALNVDGAAKGSGAAGGGAIIRDHDGQFISALSANFGHCSSFEAEVSALVEGLKLAKELYIEKLELQMDNQACVEILRSQKWGRSEYSDMFEHIMKLIDSPNWTVKIKHVYREGNRVADWLANQGVAQHIRLEIFDSAPLELDRILAEDSMGVGISRLIPQ